MGCTLATDFKASQQSYSLLCNDLDLFVVCLGLNFELLIQFLSAALQGRITHELHRKNVCLILLFR